MTTSFQYKNKVNTERERINIYEEINFRKVDISKRRSTIRRDFSIDKLKSENNILNTKTGFDIDAIELENLMGKYKERGNDFQDIKYLKEKGIDEIILQLKTNTETGLDNLEGREEVFGSNKVFVEPVPPFCSYVWEALKDLMVRILIVSAVVSIVLGVAFSVC